MLDLCVYTGLVYVEGPLMPQNEAGQHKHTYLLFKCQRIIQNLRKRFAAVYLWKLQDVFPTKGIEYHLFLVN